MAARAAALTLWLAISLLLARPVTTGNPNEPELLPVAPRLDFVRRELAIAHLRAAHGRDAIPAGSQAQPAAGADSWRHLEAAAAFQSSTREKPPRDSQQPLAWRAVVAHHLERVNAIEQEARAKVATSSIAGETKLDLQTQISQDRIDYELASATEVAALGISAAADNAYGDALPELAELNALVRRHGHRRRWQERERQPLPAYEGSSNVSLLFGSMVMTRSLQAALPLDAAATLTSAARAGFAAAESERKRAKRTPASVSEYAPGSSEGTVANNEFFRWQMETLRATGQIWEGFTQMEVWPALVAQMRAAAAEFLIAHGMSSNEATRRCAASRLIVWASIHDDESEHPVHTHDDALVSGVFYSAAPSTAGALEFADPRGTTGRGPTASLATPPFIFGQSVPVEVGKLVVFPGWLPHSVEPTFAGGPGGGDSIRISFSFNLLGSLLGTEAWKTTILGGTARWERNGSQTSQNSSHRHGDDVHRPVVNGSLPSLPTEYIEALESFSPQIGRLAVWTVGYHFGMQRFGAAGGCISAATTMMAMEIVARVWQTVWKQAGSSICAAIGNAHPSASSTVEFAMPLARVDDVVDNARDPAALERAALVWARTLINHSAEDKNAACHEVRRLTLLVEQLHGGPARATAVQLRSTAALLETVAVASSRRHEASSNRAIWREIANRLEWALLQDSVADKATAHRCAVAVTHRRQLGRALWHAGESAAALVQALAAARLNRSNVITSSGDCHAPLPRIPYRASDTFDTMQTAGTETLRTAGTTKPSPDKRDMPPLVDLFALPRKLKLPVFEWSSNNHSDDDLLAFVTGFAPGGAAGSHSHTCHATVESICGLSLTATMEQDDDTRDGSWAKLEHCIAAEQAKVGIVCLQRGPGAPLILRGAAVDLVQPHDHIWSNDDLLAAAHSSTRLNVENELRESRSVPSQTMSVAHFLRRYRNEELYAVSPLPITMAAQLLLPKLLMLGASSGNDGGWLTSALALSNIWLSAGGTTSALHADDYDGLLCLLPTNNATNASRKRLWLAHPKHRSLIEASKNGWGHGTAASTYGEFASNINTSAIDLVSMPDWENIEWQEATLSPGDCAFLPAGWYHQVRTEVGRSLAVNVWWERPDFMPPPSLPYPAVARTFAQLDAEWQASVKWRSYTWRQHLSFADCSWGLDSNPARRAWDVQTTRSGVVVVRNERTLCRRHGHVH